MYAARLYRIPSRNAEGPTGLSVRSAIEVEYQFGQIR
jgi:hypothetical protein